MIGDPFGYRVNIPFSKLINATGTVNLFTASGTAYLYSLMYFCTAAGTTWNIKIQDNASTPNPIYNIAAATVSTTPVVIFNFDAPIPIIGGLSVVTAGTAGSLNVWGNYSQQ
jgi:hypothetical protein